MLNSNFFSDALSSNSASLPLKAEAMIVAEVDGMAVVPCRNLDIQEFARLEFCKLEPARDPRPGTYRYWGGEDYDKLYTSFQQVIWEIVWNKISLRIVHLEWETGCGGESRDWVVAESFEVAESFILDVERRTHAPRIMA